MKKRILVTGGAGYVGSALVPALLARGYEVRVFDKLVFGEEGLAEVRDKVELVTGDILNPPSSLVEGVSAVVHLAGLSTEPTSYVNPRVTDRINHLGTETIARLAKEGGVKRLVFASSCSVYFTYDTTLVPPVYKETDRVNSISPYSLSKRAAEEALIELNDDRFTAIILRKGTIFGFAPKMRYDLVLNAFTRDAFSRRRITVHSDGEIYRPLLDINSAVAAYIVALEAPKLRGAEIFNVLDVNTRIGDLAIEFAQLLKRTKNVDVAVEFQPTGVARNYCADGSKFKQIQDATALRSRNDAVLEMWEKLESGHDFQNPRYYTDAWYSKYSSERS